ncbi:pilus assembly protein TadG-related protein [Pantoea agglomerans]|nr:pilus assembly protein TadG-related protein [Pantoea agglomerans]
MVAAGTASRQRSRLSAAVDGAARAGAGCHRSEVNANVNFFQLY